MRILDFIVSGQTIKRDPSCDFTGLVAGSRGYVLARFRFSTDWAGCKKVVIFSGNGTERPTPLTNNMCEIPAEVLTGTAVQVRAVGRRDGYQITTGTVAFSQSANH